jgi:hypothetical protein
MAVDPAVLGRACIKMMGGVETETLRNLQHLADIGFSPCFVKD